MIQPTNEAEVIELFNLAGDLLGWRIVESWSNRFPDAIIENANGQRLSAEFEYTAKNFREHGHDPAGCDLIICWRNGWPDAPLPVWALSECIPADSNAAVALGVSCALEMLLELQRQLWPQSQPIAELCAKHTALEKRCAELERQCQELQTQRDDLQGRWEASQEYARSADERIRELMPPLGHYWNWLPDCFVLTGNRVLSVKSV